MVDMQRRWRHGRLSTVCNPHVEISHEDCSRGGLHIAHGGAELLAVRRTRVAVGHVGCPPLALALPTTMRSAEASVEGTRQRPDVCEGVCQASLAGLGQSAMPVLVLTFCINSTRA